MKPSKSEKKILLVVGPTAVGKTDKSILLAQEHQCEIISCDSRQIYKELNIGVAKPDINQLSLVKHHFISHVSIHQNYDAGSFAIDGRNKINELFKHHNHIVVCGGTGLYAKALLKGLDSLPSKNDTLRAELDKNYQTNGIKYLQDKLSALDEKKFANIDQNNPQRLIRAIEIASAENTTSIELPEFDFEFEIETILLDMDRPILYERINKRVDQMVEQGLENEAELLYPHRVLNALQTVGYKEWWPYIEKEYSREAAIEKIKQHTRNYAKRQLTWYRNQVL
ncbi:MAG: tRNA (adenosine(37)-N6)-dimethylallyltransferase MiaA [Bacteroidia bacterium]|nr:tRNA (adenosine(37)-N6)-dimethylallyltransferase MiaA [Bacteroidia bacterium]